jgi:hypothetical protein
MLKIKKIVLIMDSCINSCIPMIVAQGRLHCFKLLFFFVNNFVPETIVNVCVMYNLICSSYRPKTVKYLTYWISWREFNILLIGQFEAYILLKLLFLLSNIMLSIEKLEIMYLCVKNV